MSQLWNLLSQHSSILPTNRQKECANNVDDHVEGGRVQSVAIHQAKAGSGEVSIGSQCIDLNKNEINKIIQKVDKKLK